MASRRKNFPGRIEQRRAEAQECQAKYDALTTAEKQARNPKKVIK